MRPGVKRASASWRARWVRASRVIRRRGDAPAPNVGRLGWVERRDGDGNIVDKREKYHCPTIG